LKGWKLGLGSFRNSGVAFWLGFESGISSLRSWSLLASGLGDMQGSGSVADIARIPQPTVRIATAMELLLLPQKTVITLHSIEDLRLTG